MRVCLPLTFKGEHLICIILCQVLHLTQEAPSFDLFKGPQRLRHHSTVSQALLAPEAVARTEVMQLTFGT